MIPQTRLLAAISALLIAVVSSTGCQSTERLRTVAGGAPVADWARSPDEDTIVAPVHLVNGFPARNPDGTINAVVEIPTGTTAKFEVDRLTGELKWEYRNGQRRVVDFLGYPGNYGMVPSTLLAESDGGDGDPLDVLILGSALERGQVIKVRVLGMLRLVDDGEIDDKLIAVPVDPQYGQDFSSLHGLHEMEEIYPPAMEIIRLWFTNYKGPRVVESRGWAYADEAMERVTTAEQAFQVYGGAVMATANATRE